MLPSIRLGIQLLSPSPALRRECRPKRPYLVGFLKKFRMALVTPDSLLRRGTDAKTH